MVKRKGFIFLMITLLVIGMAVPAFADTAVTDMEVTVNEVSVDAKMIEEKAKAIALEQEQLPEPKINKDQALEIAKKALNDLFEMSVDDKKYNFTIENRKDWSNPELYVWQMNWNYNDAAEYVYAYVMLNAMTGDILEISKDGGSYTDTQTKLTTITKDEAKQKAEAFIGKVVPGLLDQTVYNDNGDDYYRKMYGGSYPVYYYFNYIRLYNGIKYDNNYINVGIDGATGEIRNFNYRWDDLEGLPSKDGIVTMEQAAKILKDNTIMELIYLPIRDQYKYEAVPKSVKLAYRASYNFANLLDAKTGKMIGYNGKERDQSIKVGSITEKQMNDILSKAKPLVKKEKEITKERAQELAQKMLSDEIEGTVKINNINYIEGDGYWEAAGRKAWNIDFTVEKKAESQDTDTKEAVMPLMNGRIMIDALTEEVLAFNNWDYNGMYGQSFDPAMTWEEAFGKAIEMVAKYHPDKIDQIKTDQIYYQYKEYVDGKEIPPMEYYFNFVRKVNGVLYEENSINISFNNRTGKLMNLNCRWQDNADFPTVEKALSADEAKDIMFRYNEVELAYSRFNNSNDYMNPQYETKLIYRLFPKKPQFNMYMLMDAVTGKPMDYNGKEIPDYDSDGFDSALKGHWVERSAKLLAQQGIVEPGTFKPDEAITKIDAVKMLVKARGMDYYYPMAEKAAGDKISFLDVREDSDDYRYIQTAIRYGIIDNQEGSFNGDAALTREQLAVMMVKTLRYDTLAKANNIFKLDFKDQSDVSADLKGYVAICKGLELIREEKDNSFRPKDKATMAEAADMVYKSMAFMNR